MKKLMIAAAIVCAAAISQGATVNWTAAGITEGETAVSGVAYLFTADTYSRTEIGAAIQAAFKANTLDSFLDTYSVYGGSATSGSISETGLDPSGWGVGAGSDNKHTYYSVVFDDSTIDNDTNFFVSKNLANKYVPTGDGSLTLGYGNLSTASTADGAWTAVAVPEPTSGLLLLLGMAGLALRRKQK